MYNVFYVLPDRRIMIAMYKDQPATFDSSDLAWDYIDAIMSMPEHPSLMWVRKAGDPDASPAN